MAGENCKITGQISPPHQNVTIEFCVLAKGVASL